MSVFGVPVALGTFHAVRAWFFDAATTRSRAPRIVHFAGSGSLAKAWRDVAHRSLLARADLVLAEGACLAAYAVLAGARVRPRFDAVATLHRIFSAADPANPLRVFLLGGERGRATRAAQALSARFPGVRIVGATHGLHALEDVNETCADVLLVGGVGSDTWVDENVELLDVGVVASVGDAIDALGGDFRRAPRATRPVGPLGAITFLVRAVACLLGASPPSAAPRPSLPPAATE